MGIQHHHRNARQHTAPPTIRCTGQYQPTMKCTSRWKSPILSPARNAVCNMSSGGSSSVIFPFTASRSPWVVHRRYICRACKITFSPQLPKMVDGFRITLRMHEYVEKESFLAAQTGLTIRRYAPSSTSAPSFWSIGTASRRPHSGHRRAVPQQALPLHPDQHR